MTKSEQAVLALLVTLLENESLAKAWRDLGYRQQNAMKLRLARALSPILAPEPPQNPAP